MKWIKLDATPSTNAYLKKLLEVHPVDGPVVVLAKAQTAGRGQKGTIWESESGKNLTMSYLARFGGFSAHRQFELNMAISLGVLDALTPYQIPGLQLKWPNDILSSTAKIGGVLIENQLKGAHINQTIIGLGLNVNQRDFPGLPRASSLLNAKPQLYSVDQIASEIIGAWELRLGHLKKSDAVSALKTEYEQNLLGYQTLRQYQKPNGEVFEAEVLGIRDDGRIQLQCTDGKQESFGLKEVEWLWDIPS